MRRLYWVKEGLKVVGFIFGATALYSLFMALLNTDEDPLQSFFRRGTIYFVIMGVLMSLLGNMGIHQNIIPFSLRFGGTRKEAIWGVQLYRSTILIPLLAGAFALLTPSLSNTTAFLVNIPVLIGAYLFLSGLGSFSGALTKNTQRGLLAALYIIFVFLSFLISGAVAIAFVFFQIGSEHNINFATLLSCLFMVVCIIFYGICSVFEVRSIRRHYVR